MLISESLIPLLITNTDVSSEKFSLSNSLKAFINCVLIFNKLFLISFKNSSTVNITTSLSFV